MNDWIDLDLSEIDRNIEQSRKEKTQKHRTKTLDEQADLHEYESKFD